MSREGEPPTSVSDSEFEPLRPPAPVPAPPLPEEEASEQPEASGWDNEGRWADAWETERAWDEYRGWREPAGSGPSGVPVTSVQAIDAPPAPVLPLSGPTVIPSGPPGSSIGRMPPAAASGGHAPSTSGGGSSVEPAGANETTDPAGSRPEPSGTRPELSGADVSRTDVSRTDVSGTDVSGARSGPVAGAARVEAGQSAEGSPPDAGSGELGSSPGGFGGRHARRGTPPAPAVFPIGPRLDYIPRHAAGPAGGASQVSATDLTEVLSRVREDPTERPMADRPDSNRSAAPEPMDWDDEEEDELEEAPPVGREPEREPYPPGKRVRVVLSQRKGQARPVRTVVDVQELTQVGEVLSSSLIRSQLALALRIAAIAVLGLGALPAMFYFVPALAGIELFGLRLPWLLLGVAVYPFMLLLGWLYTRSADNLERIFADHIQT